MYRIVVVLVMVGLLVASAKPAGEGLSWFQKIVQFMVNSLDSKAFEVQAKYQLDRMRVDKNLCYKNSECKLVWCGKRPNTSSDAMNVYYTPDLSDVCDDEGEAVWDAYVSCVQGSCEYKRVTGW